MRFGDYIRELRRTHNWTQPEAAREIGIEQSYLSKLESGKSYPSEEIFASLMTAYTIELSELSDKLFPAELDRLRQINQVRSTILRRENEDHKKAQQWLIAGIAALMTGGAFLGTALLAKDTQVTTFLYKSEVTIDPLDNDNANTPLIIEKTNGEVIAIDKDGIHPDRAGQRTAARSTIEHYKSIEDYRGVVFFETLPDGPRTWRFYGSASDTVRSPLRWFMIPATMLILGAPGFFFASYRSR